MKGGLSNKKPKRVRLLYSLPESQIIKIWQHQLLDSTELATEGGEPIKIIYPGRINDGRGADFRDAVITTNRGLLKRDIEVHVKTSAWRAHRHHHDPVYNRVILHMVWHDTKATTNLRNGNYTASETSEFRLFAISRGSCRFAGSTCTEVVVA